jgi:signal transduction histidine kinase
MLATAVAVLAGLAQGLQGVSAIGGAIMASLSALLLLVATWGMRWAENRAGSRWLHGMLALHGALVALALVVSGGKAFIMSMPLVSMLVLYLPVGVALLGVVVLTALLGALVVQQYSVELLGSALLQLGAAESFVIMFSLIARRERYARAEVERLQYAVAELAVVSERGRLARELHDSLGHYLTVMSIQLEALAQAQPAPGAERIASLRELVRDALLELRRAVSALRERSEESLPTRLERLINEHPASDVRVTWRVLGDAGEIAPEFDAAMFRALQEALTNVRRHARARHVHVTLTYLPQTLRLEIVDDGNGAGTGQPAGHGLKGMSERVAELGGVMTAGPLPSGGFRVQVELPRLS